MSGKFSETLKQLQPVVYQTLYNSLKQDKVAHAYLFSGLVGTPRKETAYLLAQSLVCEHADAFACEECDVCRRIKEGNYADIIFVDGKDKQIKVDEIRRIIEEFNKTGLEGYNKKIYIIDYVENCNDSALNALLKFLEEPAGSSVYAILLTEHLDRILPTIISRCQTIQFKPLGMEVCYNVCVENGYDTFDAYLLSNMYRDLDLIREVYEGPLYQPAKGLFVSFIEDLSKDKDMARLNLMRNLDFMPAPPYNRNEAEKGKILLGLFVKMNAIFFNDLNEDFKGDISWYSEYLEKFKGTRYDRPESVELWRDAENKFLPSESFNQPLVLDQLLYKL